MVGGRLVAPALVERARSDQGSPRREIRQAFRAAVRAGHDLDPTTLPDLGRGRALFGYNTQLRCQGLAVALDGDARAADQVDRLVSSLDEGRWRSLLLHDHVHVPVVATGLALAIDLAGPQLGEDRLQAARALLTDMADELERKLRTERWGSAERTQWNHHPIGWSALGIAAIVLDDGASSGRLDDAVARCRAFLEVGVTDAGLTREGLNYCGFVFQHVGVLLHALELAGRQHDLVDATIDARLARVPTWYAHEVLPRGSWLQAQNDATFEPHTALNGFLVTFGGRAPAVVAAVWDRLVGASGRRTFGHPRHGLRSSVAEALLHHPGPPPDPSAVEGLVPELVCPDRGYVAARSGWDAGASVFTFTSGGGVDGIHEQSDKNAFTYIADGRPMALDAGYGNRPVEGGPSSSFGHSSIIIDGRGQFVCGHGRNAPGRLAHVVVEPGRVSTVGDATQIYGFDGYNPVRHAVRHVTFRRGPLPYLVTFDDVDKDGDDHEFEYLLHVPEVVGRRRSGATTSVVVGDGAGQPIGAIDVLHPGAVDVNHDELPGGLPPFADHHVVRIRCHRANPLFVVLLRPVASAEPPPVDHVLRVGDDEVRLSLRTPAVEEVHTFARRLGPAPSTPPRFEQRAGSAGA